MSVGIAIFAVAELVRPRYEPEGTVHPRGVAGRGSGLGGFAQACPRVGRFCVFDLLTDLAARSGSRAAELPRANAAYPGIRGERRPSSG